MSQEWDNEGNNNESSDINGPNIIDGSGSFWSTSFTATAIHPYYIMNPSNNVTFNAQRSSVESPEFRLGTANLNFSYVQPEQNSLLIQPITFNYSNASWRFILCLCLSILFSPVLIITSKLFKRKCGFGFYVNNY